MGAASTSIPWRRGDQAVRSFGQRSETTAIPAVALAWCLLNPLVATVTFGARSVTQLRQNLKAEAVLAEQEEQLRAAFITAGWTVSDIAKSTVA